MRLIALAMTIHIPPDPLTDFCAEIFARAGCEPEEAGRVSASLVDANLTGHDSHGVIRVPRYVDWVRSGDLVPNQSLERIVDTPVIGVVDGHFGFGQTMAPMAVDIGVEKAKATGLSAISLRNSGHIGRVGEWAERAAAAGLISIHFVNAAGSILVAPFGGLDRRLSTAPFCAGIPREGAPPVVLDFATSLVAEGKVNVASDAGKSGHDPWRTGAGRARKTHGDRRTAAERGLGVDRRSGAERRGEPGPLVLSRSFDPPICVQTSDAARSRDPDSTH